MMFTNLMTARWFVPYCSASAQKWGSPEVGHGAIAAAQLLK